jgi:Mg/Co/Ni transporter MgtE
MLVWRLGLDPAVMAGPFITTAVDALSLLMLCGTAFLLL